MSQPADLHGIISERVGLGNNGSHLGGYARVLCHGTCYLQA